MRTELDAYDDSDFEATVCDADLIGYFHPREIVQDPQLTVERKRQLISYWLSDVHAVPNAPAFRSYQFGPAVTVDDLRASLEKLDSMVDAAAIPVAQGQSAAA
jgi:hypothetical protein